jgi:DNA-binding transcriptional ArsR family regulator
MDDAVRSLLETHIDSFEGLEALLLLRRRRGLPMALESVHSGIRIPTRDLDAALLRLERAGLVTSRKEANTTVYTYEPKSQALSDAVERLAAAYADSPVEIARLLSVKAIERVRSEAAQLFADAFVLGRKKDG